MNHDTIDDFEPIVILSDAEWAELDRPIARAVAWCRPRLLVRVGRRSMRRQDSTPVAIPPLPSIRFPVSTPHRRLIAHGHAPQGDHYLLGLALRPFLAAA